MVANTKQAQSVPGDPQTSAPSFAAFSAVELGTGVRARVLFPGASAFPRIGTAGYVRSRTRAARAVQVREGKRSIEERLPWRDYDDTVLTSTDSLVAPDAHHHFIISARNTLNEHGYQIRVNGTWYRRCDEAPVDPSWPVIAVGETGINVVPLKQVNTDSPDLVTGIPLVISGEPSTRAFLIASCSDVSHLYEVDPQGRIGPSANAWTALSERWQELRDSSESEAEIAQQMQSLAESLNVRTTSCKLHSMLAQRPDGTLVAFAITGPLPDIAQELARWRIQHAVLLDNGGSVGWQFVTKGQTRGTLLIAGPNYRPRGIAFLDIWLQGFLHPSEHGALQGARTKANHA